MKKIREYLHIAIFIMTALLVAVAGLKIYSVYWEETAEERMRYEEILARNTQAQNRVMEMEIEISEMTNDKETLQRFINETMRAAEEKQRQKAQRLEAEASVDNAISDNMVSGNEPLSGNSISGNDLSGNGVSGNSVSGNYVSISGNSILDDSVSGNLVSGNSSVSDNSVSGNLVSGNNSISDNSISANGVLGNIGISENAAISGNDGINGNRLWEYNQTVFPLEEKRKLCSSYEETKKIAAEDKKILAKNTYDFSNLKIACLGDSITAAANLEGEEDYIQYSYPSQMQEMLGAKKVYNLGIGGSSIGRYWADAFVDRYQKIPKDTDIIIVMGGTNDGFCVSDEEFGSLEERAYRTFCGDLDELMKGLRKDYPQADIFFATPLPNILQDYLMSERDYLLPQNDFVGVIWTMAREYDFQVIDLYNSNLLDSHDANVIAEYMPDGVHANPEGYRILAQHFASKLVQYYEKTVEEE